MWHREAIARLPAQSKRFSKAVLLAWQSEGVQVRYRNIMIKLFPEDPLYSSLYTPTAVKDYRIFPKAASRPSMGISQGAVRILKGGETRSVVGRALPVPGL